MAIVFVSKAIRDRSHLLDPVIIEFVIPIQTKIGHGLARGTAALTPLANLDESNADILAIPFALLQKVQRSHTTGKATANDDQVIKRAVNRSHGERVCDVRSMLLMEMIRIPFDKVLQRR